MAEAQGLARRAPSKPRTEAESSNEHLDDLRECFSDLKLP
jgi:hypothetical protein